MSVPDNDMTTEPGSVSRRDFLRVGGISAVGLSMAERAALAKSRRSGDRKQVVLLLMTGGPSQLETFDPKPEAPVEVRGPLRSISTAIPGVGFSEGLPGLAERADLLAIVRSMHHTAAPIHETGLQLLQTGGLVSGGIEPPSFGATAARVLGPRGRVPAYVVLPRLLTDTGVRAYRGQTAGRLGPEFDPSTPDVDDAGLEGSPAPLAEESASTRTAYGEHRFGRLCLRARQLVECGVRVVTVNLFDSLAGGPTWDAHGRGGETASTPYDYRDELCPAFDRAASALLDDLADRGLLDDTLVVATGEFGRTPHLNARGGRDHWTGAWSAILAGGGIRGGTVLGATDRRAGAPIDRPTTPAELVATVYDFLGIDASTEVTTGTGPLAELF